MGLLFYKNSEDIVPPLRYQPSRIRSCKPITFHNPEVEFQARRGYSALVGSSPKSSIPIAHFSHTPIRFRLLGNHTITGENTTSTNTPTPPSSYKYTEYQGFKPLEGAILSDIVSMQIRELQTARINFSPPIESKMHGKHRKVRSKFSDILSKHQT